MNKKAYMASAAALVLGISAAIPYAATHNFRITVQAAQTIDAGNPVISRGVPAYSNQGNASDGNDDFYYTSWTAGDDCYLAYDLSSVPEEQRRQVIAVWYNNSSFDTVGSYISQSSEPVDYVIEVNSAPGGTYPSEGWTAVETVTENSLSTRQVIVDMQDCNWIRMYVSKAMNGSVSLNFDIHSVTNGVQDSFLFLGDSITAGGMVNAWGTSFAANVNALDSRYYPVQQNGGIGGITSADGAEHIDEWLAGCSANFVSIAYGTNDAWGNINNLESYYTNTKYMIDAVLEAGKTPILPTIPYSSNADAGKYTADYNAKVEQLYSEYGDKLLRGADLYTFFKENPDLLSDDGVHPSFDGYEAMRKFWAETVYETIYKNSGGIPEQTQDTSGTASSKGDVNADGTFDIADIVLFQKWLLAFPDTQLPDWKAADFCEDNKLDAFDMSLMRKALC